MSKALFRATKAKPRVDARQAPMFVDLDEQKRPVVERRVARDHYPTGDLDAILSLLARDWDVISGLANIWECACGKGHMVYPMRKAGLKVCASDIEDYGCEDSWVADFYTCLKSRGTGIITNPPYCEVNARDGHGRWLRHTLDMPGWDYLALLLNWDWPAARANGLGELLDERPFTYCYLMRWKLDFTGGGSPPQRNAWFVWRRDDPRSWVSPDLPDPGFRVLDRIDPRQGGLFDA